MEHAGDKTEPDILLLIYHETLNQSRKLEELENQLKGIRSDLNGTIVAVRSLCQRLSILENSPPTSNNRSDF